MAYGISFDFWNTLYASGDETQRHQQRISFFREIVSAYRPFDRDSIEKVFEWSRQFFIHNWRVHQVTPTCEARIQQMGKHLGVNISVIDIKKTVAFFGNLIRQVPPPEIDNLKTCVHELAVQYPLAIISDTGYITGKYIRQFLREENLLEYFQSLIFSDEHRHCKPHPSVFRLTCRNLGIDCRYLIHIGDLEQTDVKGILDCGGISIKYTGVSGTDQDKTVSPHLINDYKELPSLIENLTNT